MGGLFGGGGKSAPAPKKPEPEVQKPDMERREEAAAMTARRRGAGARSLLSAQREDAQTGLSTKLGGGQ
jgi:hypothetical protein